MMKRARQGASALRGVLVSGAQLAGLGLLSLVRFLLVLTNPTGLLHVLLVAGGLALLSASSYYAARSGILSVHLIASPNENAPPHVIPAPRGPTLINGGPRVMHHITVATKTDEGLTRFVRSVAWHGNSVEILGFGDPRLQQWGIGFGVKVEEFLGFARKVHPDDLILMTDAYDTLMLGGHDAVLAAYDRAMARLGADSDPTGAGRSVGMLVSAEQFCSPVPSRGALFPEADKRAYFPFLNSGTFIGWAGAIATLLASDTMDMNDDDQSFFQTLFLRSVADASLPRMALDHDNDVFLVLTGPGRRWATETEYDPAARVWRHRVTGGTPPIYHAPGWIGFKDIGVVWNALQGRYCSDVPVGSTAAAGYDAPLLVYVWYHVRNGAVAGALLGFCGALLGPLLLRSGVLSCLARTVSSVWPLAWAPGAVLPHLSVSGGGGGMRVGHGSEEESARLS